MPYWMRLVYSCIFNYPSKFFIFYGLFYVAYNACYFRILLWGHIFHISILRPSLDFWNVLLEVLVLLMMGYCLLHICCGCILGVVLPLLKLFICFNNILYLGTWMKLILMVIFLCYLYLKLWVVLLQLLCVLLCSVCHFFKMLVLFFHFKSERVDRIPCFFVLHLLLSHNLSGRFWFIFQSIIFFEIYVIYMIYI